MTIDVSRLPAPAIIETLSTTALMADYEARFLAEWIARRTVDPTLPLYDVERLRSDPAGIVGRAWSLLRLLDRRRVNEAIRAVLAPLAVGADLDNVVARQGVERLVVTPATSTAAAAMESDARLLRRYLASFERAAAGSAASIAYWTLTAWPACLDVAVIGRAVHGRRGDVDVALLGPGGRAPTTDEILAVRAALLAPGRSPEAVAVTVLAAQRRVYDVDITVEIPSGPDPSLVVAEVEARIRALAVERMTIGAQLPAEAVAGAAYGPSVERVRRRLPAADLAPEPYGAPVLGTLTIATEQSS
jgi:phage-related baseplate assembly protein